jgi:LysM repeat protein
MAVASPHGVIVHPGDCLSAIAAANGTTWQAVYQLNRDQIRDPNLVCPGQVLRLPGHGEAAPAPAPAHHHAAPAYHAAAVTSMGAPGSFQHQVAQAESGGDPTAVNPSSGAGGLYQFIPSTWAALGYARQYPGGAQTAPVSVQNQAFAKAYALWGSSPWTPYNGVQP